MTFHPAFQQATICCVVPADGNFPSSSSSGGKTPTTSRGGVGAMDTASLLSILSDAIAITDSTSIDLSHKSYYLPNGSGSAERRSKLKLAVSSAMRAQKKNERNKNELGRMSQISQISFRSRQISPDDDDDFVVAASSPLLRPNEPSSISTVDSLGKEETTIVATLPSSLVPSHHHQGRNSSSKSSKTSRISEN
uniref:Uncharacterized protein n=1 Tax=Odontella aurita TaxID=265563 RepID=A0A7S4N3V5_9STRA|mmetsp:Transcript_46818/g.141821  ORF Transcript_46818/g.141821 Transcript_46818/m.141821 type:complete len:194 (+) Transcript_46818:100-681(+)